MAKTEEPFLTSSEKAKMFFSAHWRGFLCLVAPLIFLGLVTPFPGEKYQWCAYTLLVMAVFWVAECIPLAVTAFLPVVIFPMTGVASTATACKAYVNMVLTSSRQLVLKSKPSSFGSMDSVLMFLGSIMLAYAVEQSGLHKRLAYAAIRMIGYSHFKLLFAMCAVTTFVSMWITNTAATTMMVPIIFALLRVFEAQGILVVFEEGPDGEKTASDMTSCYFCAATFSATIGGIGTLVGTATNLVFKGLFMSAYPEAPEYLSFPKFSAFAVPYIFVLEAFTFIYLAMVYFGFMRPGSDAAKAAFITEKAKAAAKKAIDDDWERLGKMTYWESMVILLFGGAMVAFFCRSPQMFDGWGDLIAEHFDLDHKFIRDSALAMLVCFLMFLLPSSLVIFKNCNAKYYEDLPKKSVQSVLDWKVLNASMPYSYMFLLGGGFALSSAAKTSGLNAKLGEYLQVLKNLPNIVVLLLVIISVCFITNFASNVAVCNVFSPISMQLAKEINQNPLWYCIASGITASYCFMLPVGTPGNLIVQCAANIPTKKMMVAGAGPTVTTIIVTWLAMYFWAPVVWPVLNEMPEWTQHEGKGL